MEKRAMKEASVERVQQRTQPKKQFIENQRDCRLNLTTKCHLVYAILCVVVLLYVVFLYNLTLRLSAQSTKRLTERNNCNCSFHEIKGKTQRQEEINETINEIEGNSEPSKQQQGLRFINKRKGISLAQLKREKMLRTFARTRHPQKFAPRTNLIILSPGRGGSSFLGGIFDSNPQVMYWFEPLFILRQEVFKMHLLKENKEPAKYKETCSNVIDSLFKCDFSNITKATLRNFSKNIFRYRSNSLTSGYLCPGRYTSRRCLKFTIKLLRKACNSYKHTVIKILTSRVPNNTLQSFQELFQQDRYDVKLIHLVRDPRAVVHSMVDSVKWIGRNYRDQDFRLDVHGICDAIEQNIKMGLLNPPSWLRNRFKVIRFEDLVVNTVNIAHELYGFAGFDWSMSVDRWISAHNRPPSNAKEGNVYSLYRNASDVIHKWKNAPKELITVVEDVCGDLMDILGYDKLIKQD